MWTINLPKHDTSLMFMRSKLHFVVSDFFDSAHFLRRADNAEMQIFPIATGRRIIQHFRQLCQHLRWNVLPFVETNTPARFNQPQQFVAVPMTDRLRIGRIFSAKWQRSCRTNCHAMLTTYTKFIAVLNVGGKFCGVELNATDNAITNTFAAVNAFAPVNRNASFYYKLSLNQLKNNPPISC